MADTKISDLTSLASASATDLIPIVDDIGGTPTTKQIAFSDFEASITALGTIGTGVWQGTAIDGTYLDLEGTELKSTGEAGGSKFLREDGDGTCSWQSIPGGGDALTSSPLSQFAATTSAQLAGVISDETGTGALVFANTPTLVTPVLGTPTSGTLTNCTGYPSSAINHDDTTGFVAAEHIDWTADQGATNIHSGNIPDLSSTYLTVAGTDNIKDTHIDWGTGANQVSAADVPIADAGTIITATDVEGALQEIKTAVDLNTTHAADNSQAHSDYLINNGSDSTSGTLTAAGFLVTGDASSADTAYVPMILYNTDATPPAASGFPIGTLYVQYTA